MYALFYPYNRDQLLYRKEEENSMFRVIPRIIKSVACINSNSRILYCIQIVHTEKLFDRSTQITHCKQKHCENRVLTYV